MKPTILILIIVFLTSCISDTQQQGLNEVSALYHAKTSYSKGFNKSAGQKTIKHFNIDVSDSEMIDSLNAVTTCPNIALIVYKNFTEKEKKTYTHIHVELETKKDTVAFNYEPKVLENGLQQVSMFTEFSENLLAKNYNGMIKQINTELIIKDLEIKLKNYFDILIKQHGDIKKYIRTGFGSVNLKNGEKLFRFSGYLTFNDGYNRFYFVNVSMDTKNKKIQGYDFLNK